MIPRRRSAAVVVAIVMALLCATATCDPQSQPTAATTTDVKVSSSNVSTSLTSDTTNATSTISPASPQPQWDEQLQALDGNPVNTTYLRCAYSAGSYLRILNESNGVDPKYRFDPLKQTWNLPPLTDTEKKRAGKNDCGLEWITDAALYSGIDSIVFVGDSTIMRNYMFVRKSSEEEYTQKVQKLDEDFLNDTLKLSSGRLLKLHFIRLLHVRESTQLIDKAFELATRQSMIVFSFGPHDTSWLVFRRPMPGFKKQHVGVWKAARVFWERHSTVVMNRIATNLMKFDAANRRSEDDPSVPVRPFVVIREQYLPNCKHPKYAKYPLITKCPDLLHPIVVPHYRAVLRSLLGSVNIPTVGIDAWFPVCTLIDAGHLARWCKRFELQMLVQAFRLARRSNIWQGFRNESHHRNVWGILGKVPMDQMAKHLLVRPLEPLAERLTPEERQAMVKDPSTASLFKRWDVVGQLELDMDLIGANETRSLQQTQPEALMTNFSVLPIAEGSKRLVVGVDIQPPLPPPPPQTSHLKNDESAAGAPPQGKEQSPNIPPTPAATLSQLALIVQKTKQLDSTKSRIEGGANPLKKEPLPPSSSAPSGQWKEQASTAQLATSPTNMDHQSITSPATSGVTAAGEGLEVQAISVATPSSTSAKQPWSDNTLFFLVFAILLCFTGGIYRQRISRGAKQQMRW